MAVRARESDSTPPRSEPAAPRPLPRGRGLPASDHPSQADAPVGGVHWSGLAAALGAAVWFVLAAVVFYGSGDPASDYLLWIVGGFAAGFFLLTLGLARWAADDPRWSRRGPGRFRDSIARRVAIDTGAIGGREALTQLLTIPVTLAIGATLIGIAFRLAG